MYKKVIFAYICTSATTHIGIAEPKVGMQDVLVERASGARSFNVRPIQDRKVGIIGVLQALLSWRNRQQYRP